MLVRGVAFDRLDQVGDEIGASAQLDFDAAPPLLQHVPRPYQTVVGEHDIKRRGDSERADDVTGTPEMHEISSIGAQRSIARTGPMRVAPSALILSRRL